MDNLNKKIVKLTEVQEDLISYVASNRTVSKQLSITVFTRLIPPRNYFFNPSVAWGINRGWGIIRGWGINRVNTVCVKNFLEIYTN